MSPIFKLTFCCLALTTLAGCTRSLDQDNVREFIDLADNAARKRYAPEICELRGRDFTLELQYKSLGSTHRPRKVVMDRKLYCHEAGSFARLRQYKLERTFLDIKVADDGKTAKVLAEYKETMPHYEEGVINGSPDNFTDFVVIVSRDESVVGIEGGDIRFLNAQVKAREIELFLKTPESNLPYD